MRNETGVPLSYRKATAAGPLANAQANPIESGVEAPLQLWSSDAVQHTLHCITVGRHGAWETRPLPVASTGTFVVPLMHTRGGGGGGSGGGGGEHGVGALVARVELADEGSTSLLRLGSLVQLRNCTGTPLEIQVDHEGAVDPEVLPDLAPSASTSVPLHLLHGGVMLRPAPKGRSVTLDSLASSTGSGKDASLRTIESGVEARSTTASTERSSVGFHSGEPNGSGEFHWPEPASVLWVAGLLSVQRSRRHLRLAMKLRQRFELPESEHLLESFRVVRLRPTRARGLLCVTTGYLLFYSSNAATSEATTLADITSLRRTDRGVCVGWKPDDDGIVGDATDGAATERTGEATAQLDFLPLRNSERVLQALERHVARSHASASGLARTASSVEVHAGGAAERLRTKFGLGDSERLLDSFLCAYDPKPAMHIRGRVHVFSSHLCFAGRLGAHTSELVLPLSEVVSLQQEVRHRFFLGRLARVITVITVDREYSFSTFLSPERALRAMLDVWEPMQTSIAREGIDEEDDAGADDDDDAVGRILPQVLCCFENNEQPWAGPLKPANTPLARAASREPGLREVAIGPAAAAAAATETFFASPPAAAADGAAGVARANSDSEKGGSSGPASFKSPPTEGRPFVRRRSFAERAPPAAFYTCVHVERLRATSGLPGAGVPKGGVRPVAISLHAPLTLQNTLPVAVRWSIRAVGAAGAARGMAELSYSAHRRRKTTLRQWLSLGCIRRPPPRHEPPASRLSGTRDASGPRVSRAKTGRWTARGATGRRTQHQCEGELEPGALGRVHAVSPLQSWEMVLRIGGYEASAPLTVNRGGSTEARLNQKLPEVLELRSEGEGPRPKLRVYLQNRLGAGGSREIVLYAPYWLLNRTGLPLLFREVRGVGAIKDVNIHAGRSHAMDGGADPKSAKQSRRATRSGRASAAAASRSAKSSKAAATAASIDEEEGEEGGGVVAPADVTASLDSDDGAAAAAEAMATIDEGLPPTLGAPKVAVAESATASDFDTESVAGTESVVGESAMGDSDVVSDSGRSEEEIDLFEGVSSREETDAPLLFGWAKGKDLFQGGGQVGGKDIFNRRMSIRVGARRLADARRPCGVQRPAPPDRRPPPPQLEPPLLDGRRQHRRRAPLRRARSRHLGRVRAAARALLEGRHLRAALHHTQRPRRRHVARLPPDPRLRGAAHARAGRRGRLPLAVAAVGGEDARARVGCERLGALLVVRRRRLRRRRGRRHGREHLLALLPRPADRRGDRLHPAAGRASARARGGEREPAAPHALPAV